MDTKETEQIAPMKTSARKSRFKSARDFLLCDEGSQLIEYGLMGVLIAVSCIVLLTEIGVRPSGIFEVIRDALPS